MNKANQLKGSPYSLIVVLRLLEWFLVSMNGFFCVFKLIVVILFQAFRPQHHRKSRGSDVSVSTLQLLFGADQVIAVIYSNWHALIRQSDNDIANGSYINP